MIPENIKRLVSTAQQQDQVIDDTSAMEVLKPVADIEKASDHTNNISHFVLQYDVKYGGEYENNREFQRRTASSYVRKAMYEKMGRLTNSELEVAIRRLQLMFS